MNFRCTLSVICLASAHALAADAGQPAVGDTPAPPPAYKLTAGWYGLSDDTSGYDLNLRQTSDYGNAWIGYFNLASQGVSQWRAGWDNSFGARVRVSPSIQVATQGFLGGSLGFETGDPWFAGIGIGRTNLRPYWNLNFDPNDAYTLSAGHRGNDNNLFMVQLVHDNRQNPDQQHLHFLYRHPLPEKQRLTLDALYKSGTVDAETIHRWGLTVSYDWPAFFVRVAWDPNTNFTPVDALRVSVGTRF
jgi:hypothetical protein